MRTASPNVPALAPVPTAPRAASSSQLPKLDLPPLLKLSAVDPEESEDADVLRPADGGRPVANWYEAQVALARRCISPGVVDGNAGSQTQNALRRFQVEEGLAPTGRLDAATKARLTIKDPVNRYYRVTAADVASLRRVPSTWLGKSELDSLGHNNILELVAEVGHAHVGLVRRLNPGIAAWEAVRPGTDILIPDVSYPSSSGKASRVEISLGGRNVSAYDASGHLLAFFPCSIARKAEKRPSGALRVMTVAKNPNYTFNPETFPDSPEARELGRKLILQPGPNNPVGLVWIGLSLPGYGMHGTPMPEEIGRTGSSGCFRLANWDALQMLRLVEIGTPVVVMD